MLIYLSNVNLIFRSHARMTGEYFLLTTAIHSIALRRLLTLPSIDVASEGLVSRQCTTGRTRRATSSPFERLLNRSPRLVACIIHPHLQRRPGVLRASPPPSPAGTLHSTAGAGAGSDIPGLACTVHSTGRAEPWPLPRPALSQRCQ